MFKRSKAVIDNVLQFILEWGVPGVSLLAYKEKEDSPSSSSGSQTIPCPGRLYLWPLSSVWGKTKQIRYLFPFRYQGHLTPPSQVKGRVQEALPTSVSTGSLHLQEHRAATFSTMAGGVGGVYNQTQYNSHIRVKSQDTRKVTLHEHLQRREWCLMKSFQGNVLPFYLYWLLEPKRERIWLSLNHFREILLHYIIIYHAVQLSLLQNCIHNFKIILKINDFCTTVAKRMVTEATK